MVTAQQVYTDIEKTLGHVPAFIREVPPEAVDGFWSGMKSFELADTAIPGKYKELIGLAVAAQIPCEYCVLFHKEGAKLNGATERELREAIMMAAATRQGSTILNGFQQDVDKFRAEVREIVSYVKAQAAAPKR